MTVNWATSDSGVTTSRSVRPTWNLVVPGTLEHGNGGAPSIFRPWVRPGAEERFQLRVRTQATWKRTAAGPCVRERWPPFYERYLRIKETPIGASHAILRTGPPEFAPISRASWIAQPARTRCTRPCNGLDPRSC
jgi:hypothetical protein